MENCRIIELEKEREEVLHQIAVLQRERVEISVLIIKEWQKDQLVIALRQESDSSEGISQPD